MEQYIKKSDIVAGIKKEIKDIYAGREYVGIPSWEEREIDGLEKAIEILDTLEMKEVDFEKEFDSYANGILACDIQFEPFTHLHKCAKYFYELGLKAKGE